MSARGQRCAPLQVALQHQVCHLRGEICFVPPQRFDCDHQIAGRVRFEKESTSSGVENIAHHLVGIVKGQDQYPGAGIVEIQQGARAISEEAHA